MKALILAAGYGTRLLPHTLKLPKPLFTLNSIPVLEHLIRQLAGHGCEEMIINTHHLHGQIEAVAAKLPFHIRTIYEPVILDTGGAIANARPFFEEAPFFVINSDIVFDLDLTRVYAAHSASDCLATLVLHDYEPFNKVSVDRQGHIQSFDSKTGGLAFTGIQVLSPEIFKYFPDKNVFSSIEVYQKLIHHKKVRAFVEKEIYWSDIGTAESYSRTSLLALSASGFGLKQDRIKHIRVQKLAGDGSDRLWYRVSHDHSSFILADHGICLSDTESLKQLTAFIHIGRHLFSKGIPVPRILDADQLSGMVILDDLGDTHLATLAKQQKGTPALVKLYQSVIDLLLEFSIKGAQEFDPEWTCQTPTYSKELILEKECCYFMDAFINGYLNLDVSWQALADEFDYIADQAMEGGFTGLMHRDCQSRNIMISKGKPFFIDFQSARTGPLQYDLASLLLDPYMNLTDAVKTELLDYAVKKLSLDSIQEKAFIRNYRFCCLTRNLQFLGAFAYLTRAKKKISFEQYIPFAVNSLKHVIMGLNPDRIPKLAKLVHMM